MRAARGHAIRRPEQALQRQVADYFRATLPPEVFWAHIPNGGKRSPIEAAILSGLGVIRGAPDFMLATDGRAYWIELKAEKGRISVAQSLCHKRLWDAGCPVVIARSLDDVQRALSSWGIPTRDAGMRRAA